MNTLAHSSFSPYDASLSRPPILPRPWSAEWLVSGILRQYNRVRHSVRSRHAPPTHFRSLAEIREHASSVTDIDEHLELIFVEALLCRPRVIVELGVRGGASTFVFDRVARQCGSTLISADLDDCSAVGSGSRWHFFQGDDIRFAGAFPDFCKTHDVSPVVDLLFIDTSHYYDHTAQEICSWFPYLSDRAKVIFHDTNLRPIGPRNDGCFALGWDNRRGVVRAIEGFLGITLDERLRITDHAAGWLVRHWPNCNGLTILDRL